MLDLTDLIGQEKHSAIYEFTEEGQLPGQPSFDESDGALIMRCRSPITAAEMQYAMNFQYRRNGNLYVFKEVRLEKVYAGSAGYDGEYQDDSYYEMLLTWTAQS